jgi:hypothetical protein
MGVLDFGPLTREQCDAIAGSAHTPAEKFEKFGTPIKSARKSGRILEIRAGN